MIKGEQIPIEDTTEPSIDEVIAQRSAQATQARQPASVESYFPKMREIRGGWDEHNGFIAKGINKFDPDMKTARMGESAEILLASFGVSVKNPLACVAISCVHLAYLKGKKLFEAKT